MRQPGQDECLPRLNTAPSGADNNSDKEAPTMHSHRPTLDDDEGFSLAEVLVALMIVATGLLGLLSSTLYSVKATVAGRHNQQAADYVNQAIEEVRSVEYSAVTMKDGTPELAADTRITGTGANRQVDVGGGIGPEKLDIRPVGAVDPHVETVTENNGTYTVSRYVTIPAGTAFNAQGEPAVRRVTVIVEWRDGEVERSRTAATLLTSTRRGLPLPNWTFAYNGPATVVGTTPTQTVAPGADVSFGFVVRNLGARDGWSLSAPSGWSWYLDSDQDGLWSEDTATEPLLTPASTGLLEPGELAHVVAYRVAPSTTGTTDLTFTSASEGQPTYPGKNGAGRLVVTSTVTPPTPSPTPSSPAPPSTCDAGTSTSVVDPGGGNGAATNGGYTLRDLVLFNGPTEGNTTTQAYNTMSVATSGLQSVLCNWSTDQQTAQAGRKLAAGGVGTTGIAEWRFQPASAMEDGMRGTAAATLYVQCPSTAPTLTITLLRRSSGGTTSAFGSPQTVTPSCTATTFTRVDRTLSIPTATLAAGEQLVMQVTTTRDVRLGYGTNEARARLTVGLR